MTGQINTDSSFGQAIMGIAANPLYNTFCEVGTWNGLGSTRCLYEGLKRNPHAQLYSIEGNTEMYQQAIVHWQNNPQVNVLHGTLHRNVMTPDEVKSHPFFPRIREHYELYYESERKSCMETPLVSIPPCDVILLDGGEFSTQGDWNVLYHPKLKVVILDDTQVIKTNQIYKDLKTDLTWRCIYDTPTLRNGAAIFIRR